MGIDIHQGSGLNRIKKRNVHSEEFAVILEGSIHVLNGESNVLNAVDAANHRVGCVKEFLAK
jgi:hypothetical protein